MIPLDDTVRQGVYARKLLATKLGILRFSHSSRFELARQLVADRGATRLLDYGCGDGTFLALSKGSFQHAVGVEVDRRLVASNAERFASEPNITFRHADDLADQPSQSFDTVFCMEVLEHCPPGIIEHVIDELRRLVTKSGTVIVSVPIEIGVSLVAKQAYRAYAAYRNVTDYKFRERYNAGEFFKMVLANAQTEIERPVYPNTFSDGSSLDSCGHKGFNWRALRERLREHFDVQETRFSPLPLAGPLLNSQAWFLCSPR